MRQVLFVLAVLGALTSGWIPALAATLSAGQDAGMHATHQKTHEKGHGEHGKAKPAAHPIACSACFAIEAQRLEPRGHVIDISSRMSAAMPRLAGRAPVPLDPPPRFSIA